MSQIGFVIGPQVDDAYSEGNCLTLLNSLPGIEKGSTLYFITIRVLTKPIVATYPSGTARRGGDRGKRINFCFIIWMG